MNRPSWDCYFMSLCYLAASRSPDKSTHAGAVIVTDDNAIVSTGYNGPVRGEENAPQTRPEKYMYFEHAERNAIYNAARHGVKLDGCRLYVNWLPCADCARAMVQSGINEVIVHKEGQETASGAMVDNATWDDSHEATFRILGAKRDLRKSINPGLNVSAENGLLRWWSGELWMPKGFFRGKEYDL